MAKDDYFVIVYKILSYLYQRLKDGETAQAVMLSYDGDLFKINERYWLYILEHLQDGHYIEGLHFTKTWGGDVVVSGYEDCRITPEGIAYLMDNSMLQKVERLLKDVKEIIPARETIS